MINESVQKKYRPIFRDLQKNSPMAAGMILLSYIAQIFVAISVGFVLISHQIDWAWLMTPVIVVFIATRLRGLNNIIHECSHFTFCKNQKLNFSFGSVAAVFLLDSFVEYRREHLTHHTHLGDFDHDLDFIRRKVFRFDEPVTRSVMLRHALTPVFLLHIWHYFSVDLSARDGRIYQVMKYVLVAFVLAALWVEPVAALLFVIVPFVWVFSAINYWTDCVDHAGLITQDNDLEQSRNIVLPKWLRVFLFPRNDSFHLVHHLFPYIPSHHFDACHEVLSQEPVYRMANNTDEQSIERSGVVQGQMVRGST